MTDPFKSTSSTPALTGDDGEFRVPQRVPRLPRIEQTDEPFPMSWFITSSVFLILGFVFTDLGFKTVCFDAGSFGLQGLIAFMVARSGLQPSRAKNAAYESRATVNIPSDLFLVKPSHYYLLRGKSIPEDVMLGQLAKRGIVLLGVGAIWLFLSLYQHTLANEFAVALIQESKAATLRILMGWLIVSLINLAVMCILAWWYRTVREQWIVGRQGELLFGHIVSVTRRHAPPWDYLVLTCYFETLSRERFRCTAVQDFPKLDPAKGSTVAILYIDPRHFMVL